MGEFTYYLLAGITQGQANTHDYGTGISVPAGRGDRRRSV